MPSHPVSSDGNTTLLIGSCIAPFLDATRFPSDGGFTDGRFCAPISQIPGTPTCCLPCPATEWLYSDSLKTYGMASEWFNVVGLILMAFMLISYIALPAQKTRSHYLSVCLVVAVLMIHLGFTIPLGAKPDQCYNEITPNDMYSSNTCAFSGAFIIAGGLSAAMWIFIRALSMNLQICFDIVPGRKFFYISQALGWGIPSVLFAATMTVTGVSFRFGAACHVNHVSSMADFWGPLMAIAGAAGILQIATFAYCVKVYLRNLFTDSPANSTSASGTGLPTYSNSMRAQTARAVYQRLKKVLWLQWRGMSIVSIILIDVIFFVIVFVSLDGIQDRILHDIRKIEPWLVCLVQFSNDKDQCLHLVSDWLVNESTVVAVLFMLGLSGLQVTLFLARPSVFPAWADFFRNRFTQRQEFVSLDARPDNMRTQSKAELLRMERGHQATTFEMQKPSYSSTMATEPNSLRLDMKSPEPSTTIISSPSDSYQSPSRMEPSLDLPYGHDRMSPTLTHGNTPPSIATTSTFPQQQPFPQAYSRHPRDYQPQDYFRSNQSRSPPPDDGFTTSPTTLGRHTSLDRDGEAERRYQAPGSSFSAPKTPSRQSSLRSTPYEPRDVWSGRGGLALNPPSEASESVEDLHHGRRVEDAR